jgi:hypothetical protein
MKRSPIDHIANRSHWKIDRSSNRASSTAVLAPRLPIAELAALEAPMRRTLINSAHTLSVAAATKG